MIQTVVKRDGRTVGFNEQKIMAAIRKAMMHTDKGEDEQLIQRITDHVSYHGKTQMTVEEIQDLVEVELMKITQYIEQHPLIPKVCVESLAPTMGKTY
jgi:ribonucleoside-triphosphate reductase